MGAVTEKAVESFTLERLFEAFIGPEDGRPLLVDVVITIGEVVLPFVLAEISRRVLQAFPQRFVSVGGFSIPVDELLALLRKAVDVENLAIASDFRTAAPE